MDSLRMKVLTKADFIQWQKIGEGASASVYRAVYTGNNMEVAIKMIDVHKMKGEMDRISQEIKIHRCLNHPSIVKLYNDFEDAEFKYLVLEYCHKGDLQKYLEARKKPLSEKEACSIFHQLVDGTIYLHSQNVIHRDFKPSNLLLTRNLDIKIADFGMSAIFQSNDVHMTLCGTPNFISPEMLTKRRHGFKTDCWSLGCLLYTLLVGRPPFDTRNVKSTFARVMKTDYKIPEFLSIDAKNLIEALLQEEPEKRIDLQEVLKHSFMKKNGFDYNKRTNKLRIQDSIDSGMGTSSTLSTKISGYSKLQSTNLIRVPSLDTLNSCDFSSDDHVGRRDYGNRHPPSPPVRLKSSPHEVSSNYSNAICQLKNRFSPLPSINDIYKSHGNEELKEIQYGQPSSNEANRFEERCTENLVDEHFLDGPVREMFNGELDAKLCNGLEENVTPKEDFQHCLHNFDDCICRSDCRCNKDSACVNQNHCHCRNYTNQAITGSHCCNNSRCYCRNAESGREHKSCQHSCDKIERHNQLNSCCESQHSVNSHSCCMRNGESIKQLSVHCSHHWYCNPSSKQCSHPEYCNCRKDLTRDRHLSHPSYDSPQTDSISIPSKDRDYRSDVTKDRNMSAGRQDRHRRTNSISSKEGADKAVRDKNDDKIQYLISPLKSTRLRPIRQKTKNAIVNILSNGEVCIEFLKNANQQERIVDVCRISQDGLKITVYKPDGKHSPSLTDRSLSVSKQKVYSYENLPRQYWKKYLYAARFVKLVRAKTPKITYYSERAKFMLMENAPDADFEGSFMLGGKITKHGDLTTVIDTDGIVYNIHSEEEAMSFKPKIQSMWEHFNQCHQYCRDLEATLQALEDLKGFSCFPIIVGRKSSSQNDSTGTDNKENLSCKDTVYSPLLDSFAISVPVSTNVMSLPGEYANKQKEKADRDVSFCKPRVLSVRDKNIVGPESPSSLNAFGGIESDPVIFSTRVPQIGHFYTLKSKAVLVKFNDGSRLLLPKDGFPLDYVDLSGKCKRYFQNSRLPSHLMEKLGQAQTVIAESQKDRKKQRTTGIT